MRRREFITLLGGVSVWPLAVRAQHTAKLPTIGLLGATTPAVEGQRVAAFMQRLRELNWIEGKTVAIESRWAEGRFERFVEIAEEFVRLKVDVIVTQGTGSVVAAKQATSVIPIVFATVGDPVGTGLIASLARPGGNVTGLSSQLTDLVGKRVELLREAVPDLRRLAVVGNRGNAAVVLEMREVETAARTIGFEVVTFEIRRSWRSLALRSLMRITPCSGVGSKSGGPRSHYFRWCHGLRKHLIFWSGHRGPKRGAQ